MNPNTATTIDAAHSSELWGWIDADTTPRVNTHVLRSTRIEKMIYNERRDQVKTGIDEIEANADVMFITDGECEISEMFADALRDKKKHLNFKVTGVLIDLPMSEEVKDLFKNFKHIPTTEVVTDFSLRTFCESVHRVSEMTGDKVATDIITNFVRNS